MKTLKFILAVLAVLLVAYTAAFKSLPLAFVESIAFGCVLLSPKDWLGECRLGTPTLITSILTGKIISPLRTKVPELDFFSVDFGMQGGEFAPPVKFGQEVISHMLTAPTAQAFTPGSSLSPTPTNPKDLLADAKVAIDQAAIVAIKLPTTDAVKYFLSNAFVETAKEATVALGRYVVDKAIRKFTQANFSQEKVITITGNEFESITDTRLALNLLGTRTPRFILGSSEWVNTLSKDPLITSGDYFGQLTGEDPYITLKNCGGFNAIREFPNMPTGTSTLGTFTVVAATNVITVSAAHGLAIGDRVRVSSATTLPAGMAANTDYYVLTVPSTTTLTVSDTFGGTVLDITDTGTGTHTMVKFEAVNAVAFEKRAIHIAFRELLDNDELANQLGIPKTSHKIKTRDPETGVSVTWYFWQDNTGTAPTGDVYASAVVAFGIRAGREIAASAATPAAAGAVAAGGGMDYGAIRIVETAAALAA